MSQEQKQALENIRSELLTAEKSLEKAVKKAERCYILDKGQIDIGIEIGGLSPKEAFDAEFSRSTKMKSQLQIMIEETLRQIGDARSKIFDFQWKNYP